jgi:DNA replication protein DnaC
MMTSNRPIEEWGKLLSDVPAASAILDRLLNHAEIIPINGRSYRLQSKAKQPDVERAVAAKASSNPGPKTRLA